ncbi:MAG: S1/P1 nuclease, partial [Clostridiales bacterium]|nr:S1/P1 nuclease [Clostridiales bacterium]
MKKNLLILITGMILCANCIPVFGWGSKGHYIIAGIAEAHLSRKAKKEVHKLLDGHAMAYYSAWMDEIRSDSTYAFTSTWHYANVDEGKTYETMDKEPKGDVITATILSINQIKDKNLPDSVRSLYLKFLIHLMGDMHCPMHAGRLTDRGGNDVPIKWKGTNTNLHSYWDSAVIEDARNWTSIEWVIYIDIAMNKKQRQAIQGGEPLDWFVDTVAYAKEI